jgi:hypothetical protein
MAKFRAWRVALILGSLTALLSACGGSDDDNGVPPGPEPDAAEEVSADAELDGDVNGEPDVEPDVEPDAELDVEPDVEPDAELDVEPDVEPDVVLGPTQAVGGTTSGGTFARSPRFANWSATTGGVLERRSARFVAVGRVSIPFFAE